ncbi:hypothetical protein L195_g024451, partial [Trifolium pratense]
MQRETSSTQGTLILGRPFMRTTRAKIDVYAGTLSTEFGKRVIQFNLFDAMKHLREEHFVFALELLAYFSFIAGFDDIFTCQDCATIEMCSACYFHIHIAPEDQEKTIFTCPFGTFAYRRMSFGLCNVPGTFQRFLGHVISPKRIEVDPAKINVTSNLPYPSCVSEIRSFLGHAGFYMRFIKDFSKIALPLSNLLQKDVTFTFDDKCKKAFDCLKMALTSTPIIQPPNWTRPFKIMCEASNYAVGAVLAQRWMLLLQEFDLEIKDKIRVENLVEDHLSRIERVVEPLPIKADFPDEQLLQLQHLTPWFAYLVNYLAAGAVAAHASRAQINKLQSDAKHYMWDEQNLWKFCSDQEDISVHNAQLEKYWTQVSSGLPFSKMLLKLIALVNNAKELVQTSLVWDTSRYHNLTLTVITVFSYIKKSFEVK